MRRFIQIGATLLFTTSMVLYLGQVTSWREFTATIAVVESDRAALLIVVTLANIASYWLVTAAVLPGLGLGRSGAAHLPANAVSNAIPAGGAFGTGLFLAIVGRWGYRPSKATAATLVSGLWNNLAKLAVPIAAVAAMAIGGAGRVSDGHMGGRGWASGAAIGIIAGAATVISIALLAVFRSERSAAALGRGLGASVSWVLERVGRRPVGGWDKAAVRLHHDVVSVARDRWMALSAATVISHATLFLLFVTSVRAVGLGAADIGLTELLTVFAFSRMASFIPLTPGGLGLIEVTLAASLTASGGSADRVVAGIVLYRLATYAAPTILGGIVLLGWIWRAGRLWHSEIPEASTSPSLPLVVDLDGTLFPVTSRSLMVARLAWTDPRGLRTYRRLRQVDRAASKLHLYRHAGLEVERAPVRRVLLQWLEEERRSGRPVYLASGAPEEVVNAVVESHPVFTDGWGSSADRRLAGEAKAELLVERFGEGGFDYVGDSADDVAVWRSARQAVLCAPSRKVARMARRHATVGRVFSRVPCQPLVTGARTVVAAYRQRTDLRPEAAAA